MIELYKLVTKTNNRETSIHVGLPMILHFLKHTTYSDSDTDNIYEIWRDETCLFYGEY